MRVVITGGAGFLGSHLCDALLGRGDSVVCVDDLSTGRRENLEDAWHSPAFRFIEADVTLGLDVPGPVDAVAHLASPASPPDYLRRPLETLAAGSRGTEHALALARRHGARFLLASTSEVYGSPQVHPQTEDYWGHVNPIGPRSVYDESKRFAEALTTAHRGALGVNTGIVRIFNTYGPRMRPDDGRVVSNFISQALDGNPITLYGDGEQTRSFCYVDDLVRGLLAMLDSDHAGPVNLGNPAEFTMTQLASLVRQLTSTTAPVQHRELPQDDPPRRRPAIDHAVRTLGWHPLVDLTEGLGHTIAWFRSHAPDPRGLEAAVAG
ncbi:SDR family oxidoreductase [Streptomyces sp. MBT65]|uniref:UDP-glucuronic acid decarboxylase family protein n=1 Tax=Streptomyces sp. MBT65 TaxID=1488395 RepID=UPI00190E5DAA|nr:UDP-glucuronic acid decarboxylase family protein [Streptomyces sp. MBT65]MBK3580971.1 SDR family oxidoreductase [Streptomyces sp. MBT65]